MFRRLVRYHGLLTFLVLTAFAASARGEIQSGSLGAPSDPIAGRVEGPSYRVNNSVGPALAIVSLLFYLYQHGVGPTKGTRCPMVPSCSEYGRISVRRYGLLRGVLMSADRLHRCGHDLRYYEGLWSPSRGWCYDDPAF